MLGAKVGVEFTVGQALGGRMGALVTRCQALVVQVAEDLLLFAPLVV